MSMKKLTYSLGSLLIFILASIANRTLSARSQTLPPYACKPELISSLTPNINKAIEDANWIMKAAGADGSINGSGAIAQYIDEQRIEPYFANLGTLGLARATQISGNPTYVNAVWNHLKWYMNHMHGNGYVTDYELKKGVWQSTGSYDSTDAYPGTFLLAARAAY